MWNWKKRQIFFRIYLKVYSSSLNHFQYLMILSHYRRPPKRRHSIYRNKCIIHLILNSGALQEGSEGYRA